MPTKAGGGAKFIPANFTKRLEHNRLFKDSMPGQNKETHLFIILQFGLPFESGSFLM